METAKQIRDTSNSLNPLRPPTAPASDIARVKKDIVAISKPNLLVVQIALATILVCLLMYLVLPANYAHPVAVLLLSVGFAVGIFLTK